MQSRGEGVKRSAKVKFPEATKTIKAQHIYLGNMLFMNKTAPSPVYKANMYMVYDLKTGKLIVSDELARKLGKLDKMLSGRLEDNDHKIDILDSGVEIENDGIIEVEEEEEDLEAESTDEE